MGDGVDKAVVLLVAPDLPYQEAGVDDHPRNQHPKENYAQKQQHPFTPVENDPANVQGDRQRDQTHAQRDKERNRFPARGNAHSVDVRDDCIAVKPDFRTAAADALAYTQHE
jgi:hypothetical protein